MPSPSTRLALPLCVVDDSAQAARAVAAEIAALVRERTAAGRASVLGLATGKSPIGVYRELARLHRDEGLSFARTFTFNLDEYLGTAPADPRSFHAFMHEHLFRHVDLAPERARVPRGDLAGAELEREIAGYRAAIAAAGGIDLQILGLGRNGHIGFNEPGSARDSRMRVVRLDAATRDDAAREFGGAERVPTEAVTLGVADILEARRVRVLAFGEKKREAVRRALEDTIGPSLPATFLRGHPDVRLYVDPAAKPQSR